MKDIEIKRITSDLEIEYLSELWYRNSVIAHDFISETYWEEHKINMKENYIPNSETYILMKKNLIIGFISMVDNYLAALFIDNNLKNKGYGTILLDYVKINRVYIELKVYKKNNEAYEFYKKRAFIEKEILIDKDTNELEYLMVWENK